MQRHAIRRSRRTRSTAAAVLALAAALAAAAMPAGARPGDAGEPRPLAAAARFGQFVVNDDGSVVVHVVQDETGRSDLYATPTVGGVSVLLSAPAPAGGDIGEFVLTADGTQVVYTGLDLPGGSYELFVASIDGGSGPRRLSQDLAAGRDVSVPMAFSPDGASAFYFADVEADERYDLYTVPLAAGAPVKLSDATSTNALVGKFGRLELTPDGSVALYVATPGPGTARNVFAAPTTPGPVRDLTGLTSDGLEFFVLSPDGRTIAYSVARVSGDLESVNVDGTGRVLLASSPPRGSVGIFQIDATSTTVVFENDTNDDGFDELYRVPLAGGEPPTNITGLPASGLNVYYFELSDDGGHVAYLGTVAPSPQVRLWTAPLAGGPAVELLPSLSADEEVIDFVITPGSRRIVFNVSGPDGSSLTSRRIDGSGDPLILVSSTDADGVAFLAGVSPDGGRLLYASGNVVLRGAAPVPGDPIELWSVPVAGGTPIKLISEASRFGYYGDVQFSADGQRVFLAPFLLDGPVSVNRTVYVVRGGIPCGGDLARFVGTAGNDTITGTPGRDVIAGLGGDDALRGLAGRDVLCGGTGVDALDGGRAADRLLGAGGDDTIVGGRGRDVANGGRGSDTLRGGAGPDRLLGKGGPDDLVGGRGRDVCVGGRGRDTAASCERTTSVP